MMSYHFHNCLMFKCSAQQIPFNAHLEEEFGFLGLFQDDWMERKIYPVVHSSYLNAMRFHHLHYFNYKFSILIRTQYEHVVVLLFNHFDAIAPCVIFRFCLFLQKGFGVFNCNEKGRKKINIPSKFISYIAFSCRCLSVRWFLFVSMGDWAIGS